MLQALIGPVTGLLDKFIEDKDQKNALAHEIATMAEKQAHEAAMAQVEAHTEQKRQHPSLLRSQDGGPAIVGWTCARFALWHGTLSLLHLPFIWCARWRESDASGSSLQYWTWGSLMPVLLRHAWPGRSADSWEKVERVRSR
jgi:hypothetical protein